MVDVFISYRRSQRAKAEPIKHKLEALGLEVFFDIQNIEAGADFPSTINDNLRASKTVLACWSELYFERRPASDWCNIECHFGLSSGRLIPVAIEPFDSDAQPVEFRLTNYFDLSDWLGEQGHEGWLRTLRELERRLDRELLPQAANGPRDAADFVGRGNVHLEQEEYAAAASDYTEAIRLNPNDAWAFYNRGRAYAGLEDSARAIEDFNEAIGLNPDDEWAFYNRGRTYGDLKNHDRAIDDLNEAIRLNPEIAEEINLAIAATLLSRGVAHLKQGEHGPTVDELENYDRAINDLNEAVRLNPKLAEEVNPAIATAFLSRGDCRFEQGEYEAAVEDYTEAIRRNSDDEWAFYDRGRANVGLEDFAGAIEDFNEAIRLDPEMANWVNAEIATALIGRGDAYLEGAGYAAAVADYTEAIRLNPDDERSFIGRGDTYLQQEEYAAAVTDYTEAIRLNPDDAWVFYNRGCAYAGLEDYDRAIDDFTEATRLNPIIADSFDEEIVSALVERGRRHLEQGNYHAAKCDLDAAARRNAEMASEFKSDFERTFVLPATLPNLMTPRGSE